MQNVDADPVFRLAPARKTWFCTHVVSSMQTSGAPTSTTRAYDDLRAAILGGELEPGERLRTAALAERFGTSRTPVREALVLLEADGLVDLEPHRGAVVRAFPADDLLDLYDVRAVLEARAAALAAERVQPAQLARLDELCTLAEAQTDAGPASIDRQMAWNEEFHRIVIEAAASPRLQAALRAVAGIPRGFRAAFWTDDHQRAVSLTCHREIQAALASRSVERAETAMRLHVLSAKDFLIEVMRDRT